MRFLTLLILLVYIFPCFGQEDEKVDAIFEKLGDKYGDSKTYALAMNYRLYKGHNSGKLSEQYNGQLFSSPQGTYQKINTTEYISTLKYSVQINHDEKAMAISNGVKQSFFKEYKTALKGASSYQLFEKEDVYIIDIYFVGPTNFPYYKLNLTVNKKNYELKEINLYYSSKVDFNASYSKSEFAKPHLKITFKSISEIESQSNWFIQKNYYQLNSGQIVLNDKYAGYSVINNLQ